MTTTGPTRTDYPAIYAIRPPTLPIAIVALCLAVVGFTLGWIPWLGLTLAAAGAACGHVAIYQLDRTPTPRSGRGLAIAGIVVGYGGVLLDVLAMIAVDRIMSAIFGA